MFICAERGRPHEESYRQGSPLGEEKPVKVVALRFMDC